MSDPLGYGSNLTGRLVGNIIPVRIVAAAPIPVVIVGGALPGQKSPTGELAKGAEAYKSIFDRMPARLESLFGRGGQAGRWAEGMTNKLGSLLGGGEGAAAGEAAGGAAAGGAAAAAAGPIGIAVGATVAVLDKLKSVFVDPLINAAQGGFQAGVTTGSGAEVLAKSAMVLGVSLGVHLLPVVLEVSAQFVTLAENTQFVIDYFAWFARMGSPGGMALAEGMPGVGGKGPGVFSAALKGLEVLAPIATGAIPRMVGAPPLPPAEKVAQEEQANRIKVMQSMLLSLGPQAQYRGIADVREAAQVAAFEDPLQKEMRNMMITQLRKMGQGEWLDQIGYIADQTDPKKAPRR